MWESRASAHSKARGNGAPWRDERRAAPAPLVHPLGQTALGRCWAAAARAPLRPAPRMSAVHVGVTTSVWLGAGARGGATCWHGWCCRIGAGCAAPQAWDSVPGPTRTGRCSAVAASLPTRSTYSIAAAADSHGLLWVTCAVLWFRDDSQAPTPTRDGRGRREACGDCFHDGFHGGGHGTAAESQRPQHREEDCSTCEEGARGEQDWGVKNCGCRCLPLRAFHHSNSLFTVLRTRSRQGAATHTHTHTLRNTRQSVAAQAPSPLAPTSALPPAGKARLTASRWHSPVRRARGATWPSRCPCSRCPHPGPAA
mmetsp:Transcript_2331/g.7815  ORF Transcript_2331/g.7815 Transcript_2331/m.7815 type:complete len:311 (+) Transcript_2331:232-1164(+)